MDKMFRYSTTEEMKRLARNLWLLFNQSPTFRRHRGGDPQTDFTLSGAMAVVSALTYFVVGDDERDKRIRAKVLPSSAFRLALSDPDWSEAQFIAAMATMLDFPGIRVVRTKHFVSTVTPVRDHFIIGVRGTQFAYDWWINAFAFKTGGSVSYHRGFYGEAKKLYEALVAHNDQDDELFQARREGRVIITGHSLGGAVASIIHEGRGLGTRSAHIFGTPRVRNFNERLGRSTFAFRRDLDVIPCVPPPMLGYADHLPQYSTAGETFQSADGLQLWFFLQWLTSLAIKRIPEEHNIERYAQEILNTAKRHDERLSEYWRA